MQVICGTVACALAYAEQTAMDRSKVQAKRDALRAKEERAHIRARKEAIKTLPQLHAEAREAFNLFIRLRDEGKLCVSCDKPLPPLGSRIGGAYDAGHFRSVGAAGHLRYHEDNCHGQCKDCNLWGAGKQLDYERRLIQRIGIERVEALKNDNRPDKWTRDEVRAIRDEYRAKAREMKKRRQECLI
jgi:hypothetical protein